MAVLGLDQELAMAAQTGISGAAEGAMTKPAAVDDLVMTIAGRAGRPETWQGANSHP